MLSLRRGTRPKTFFLLNPNLVSARGNDPWLLENGKLGRGWSQEDARNPPRMNSSFLLSHSLHLGSRSFSGSDSRFLVENQVFQSRMRLIQTRQMSGTASVEGGNETISKDAFLDTESLVQTSSEVARIASESWPPIVGLQYLIEAVHVHSSLPWWISIAAVTVGIRTLLVPMVVYQMKATGRLAKIKPELERLGEEFQQSDRESQAMEKYKTEAHRLFRENNTTPFAPLISPLIQAPLFIFFFFAVQKMSTSLESFKTGGAFWFTDLSLPDPLYILPTLSSLSLLLTIEIGGEGIEGQPNAETMKRIFRLLAIAALPLTASFPSGLFCYWLPANMMSILQVSVFRLKRVKKALGIPDVPPPPLSQSKNASNFSDIWKKAFSAPNQKQLDPNSGKPALYSNKPSKAVRGGIKDQKS